MTDLCGLKPQFDHEEAEDGNVFLFFPSVMDSDAGDYMLRKLLLGAVLLSKKHL